MRKDDWIKAAMSDDTVVAELLMRLNTNTNNNQFYSSSSDSFASSTAHHNNKSFDFDSELPLTIKWGTRKPRSKQMLLRFSNGSSVHHHHHQHRYYQNQAKKESDLIRASPTTPLSWSPGSSSTLSGRASVSGSDGGSADCYEESSRPSIWFNNSRSKVTATIGSNVRSSRKRKTFAELKQEESSLMKEKKHLKKELVTLRNSYDGRKAMSDSLKRTKLDLRSRWIKETSVSNKVISCDQFRKTHGVMDETPSVLGTSGKFYKSESREAEKKVATRQDNLFVLPDLNMPFEEDTGPEVLYGLS